MKTPGKTKGFKSKHRWQRFITVVGGDEVSPPISPRKWDAEGASECTVRIDRNLRDRLKSTLKQLSAREISLEARKTKEVDAVNEAIHDWLVNRAVNDVIRASEFKLQFDASFDLQAAILILEKYGDHLALVEMSPRKGAKTHWMLVRARRSIQKSAAYRRSLTIVLSIMSGYQVSAYHKKQVK